MFLSAFFTLAMITGYKTFIKQQLQYSKRKEKLIKDYEIKMENYKKKVVNCDEELNKKRVRLKALIEKEKENKKKGK